MLYSILLAAFLDCSSVLEAGRPAPAEVPAVLQSITEPQDNAKALRWVDVDSRALQRVAGIA